jgi:hypothetical protein
VQNNGNYSKTQAKVVDTNFTGNSNNFPGRNMIINFFASTVIYGNFTMHSRKHKHRKETTMSDKYSIPNSTVGKKISERTPLPKTLVKGSTFSKSSGMEGGKMLRPGSVSKINVPPCSPSPPAKK